MLRIFDLNKKNLGIFDGYEAFLGFITSLENQKLSESSSSLGLGYWAFAHYTPEKLKHVCAWIKPEFLSNTQLKALQQKWGLIEIYRGDSAAIQEILITSDLYVEDFKKKFCLDYCRERGWRLIETNDHKSSQNTLVGERRYVVHPHTRKSRLSQRSLENTVGRLLKAELDSCIDRLRQNPVSSNPLPAPIRPNTRKGEF